MPIACPALKLVSCSRNVSVELLTANPGSQAKLQRQNSVSECCCHRSRQSSERSNSEGTRMQLTHHCPSLTAKNPKLKNHRNKCWAWTLRLTSLSSSSFTQLPFCKVQLRRGPRSKSRFHMKSPPSGCVRQSYLLSNFLDTQNFNLIALLQTTFPRQHKSNSRTSSSTRPS